jgi:sRNA-binding regulator protein Hfq
MTLWCCVSHLTQGEHAYVTVYLFTGEQITGMMEQSEAVDDLVESRMAA